jgi:hypothetical protein
VRPLDTSPEAYRYKLEVDRSMTMAQRLELACQMAVTAREVAAAGIRMRHPEYNENQVRWALFRHCLRDDDLFSEVWPEAPLLAP